MTRPNDTARVVIGGFLWCAALALICWLREAL